jgi:hypothetical protein
MKLKRLVLILMALVIVTTTVNAQKGFAVGARLGPGFAFNELSSDVKDFLKSYGVSSPKEESLIAFALAVYGNYTILPKFSIQAELGLMWNNGMELSEGGGSLEFSFTSLDLPVLARYEFFESPVSLSVLGGPYLAFPVGEYSAKMTGSTTEHGDIEGIRFGIIVGAAAGYKLGPGSIVADLRFLTDFNPVEAEITWWGDTVDVFTRRGINLTVGYEMKF